jgi:hypothetical protein
MNGLLYRAVASVRGSTDPGVHVFFEAPPLTHPQCELRSMLSLVWWTPARSIEVADLRTEEQMLGVWAHVRSADHEALLFEVGHGDYSTTWCDPNRTLMLVSPRTLERLLQAQDCAAMRKLEEDIELAGLALQVATRRTRAARA